MLSPFAALTLSLQLSLFYGQVFWGGIGSIERGQWEGVRRLA